MKPIIIIAGCGPSGRAIALRSAGRWRPVVIDPQQEALDELVSDDVVKILGDCTSTLVLKKSPIAEAEAVVAATGSDEVNFEFCRLARELYSIRTCVALVHRQRATQQFLDADFLTVNRPDSVASIVEGRLDSGRKTAVGIGLGMGEIMQVTVQAHSPVIGKTLRMLRPQSWLLAAIYRDGKLVVPHGTTEIEELDQCLLTGDPAVLPEIANYFQRGASEFPLQFGTRYAMLQDGEQTPLDEAKYLLESTSATGLRILCRAGSSQSQLELHSTENDKDISTYVLDSKWPESLVEVGDALDIACHIVTPVRMNWAQRIGLQGTSLTAMLERTSEPILIARGTFPYKRILLAVSPAQASVRVAELAVDIARKLNAQLTVAVACPAEYVAGELFRSEAQAALQRTSALASLYGLRVQTELLEGNPVTQISTRAKEFDLLLVAHRRHRKFSLLRPDVSQLIATRATCSTMVVPYRNDDLRDLSKGKSDSDV